MINPLFLVLKAAYQYYILDRSQNQIAKDLDVSVTTVSRLLKRARDEKIIEFVIRNPYVECLNLGQEISNAFGLKEVIISPVIDMGEDEDDSAMEPEMVKKLVALEGQDICKESSKKMMYLESHGGVQSIR